MSIQDLGSIGELIAAVATVATLAYLALQIRKNTVVSKGEADRASRSDTQAMVRMIAENESVADVFLRGLAAPESLTPGEHMRFRFMLSGFIAPLSQAYKDWRHGISSERELLERIEQTRAVFQTPGGRLYWQERRDSYEDQQRKFFDDHLIQDG